MSNIWAKAEACLARKKPPMVLACRDGFISAMYTADDCEDEEADTRSSILRSLVFTARREWTTSRIVAVDSEPQDDGSERLLFADCTKALPQRASWWSSLATAMS